MARTVLNPALRLLKGRIGDFVYRRQPDGSITVSKVSLPRPGRKLSPSQSAQVERFKQAMARYRSILQDPATKAAYERLYAASGSRGRLHALVVGDIMKPPIITVIDLSSYRGTVGEIIRVVAEDSLAVARLSIAIHDLTTGLDVETATKVVSIEHLASTVEWRYTARISIPAGHAVEVRVTACDLAGNQAAASQPR
jgi:hypothetical protein